MTSVKVIVRFRPFNDREKGEYATRELTVKMDFQDRQNLVILQPGLPKQVFTFDYIFDPTATQKQIFEIAAKPTIKDVIDGFNGTIFAYGQTGAGKTFTMLGPEIGDPELWGIIPRSSEYIFQTISEDTSGSEWICKCSYLEIYKEMINDLLDTKKKNLSVHEAPGRGVYIEGLTEECITSEQDIADILTQGNDNRAVAATAMNAVSSRSHSVFILYLQQKTAEGGTKTGKLNLVDLAGSEKVEKTGAKGETLEEAKKINQSLSSLGNCIHALTEKGRGHVPYRDSKLTRILQESLGGNCKTTLLCACSPHDFNIEETVSTLNFAKRAKTIKTNARVNAQKSAAELQRIVDALKRELAELRAYTLSLEKLIEWMKSPDYAPGKQPPFDIKRPDMSEADAAAAETGVGVGSGGGVGGSGGGSGAVGGAASGDEGMDGYSEPPPPPAGAGALAEKLVETETAKAAAENKAETLATELASVQEQLRDRESVFVAAKEEATQATQKLSELQTIVDSMKQQWEQERQELHYKSSQKDLEMEAAITELEQLQQRADDATAALMKSESERDNARAEVQRAQAQVRAQAEEVAQARAAADAAAAAAASAVQRAKELETELSASKQRLDDLTLENDDLHEFVITLEAEKEETAQEANKSAAQLKLKAQQLEAAETSLKSAMARAHEFEAQISSLQAEKSTLSGRYEAELKKLRQELKDQDQSATELRDKIAKFEAESATHEEALLGLRNANADLEVTVATLQKSNAALRAKGADESLAGETSKQHEATVDRLTRQLKQAAEEKSREVAQLNAKYQSLTKRLEDDLKKAQSQRDELQQQLDTELAAAKATARRADEDARAAIRRAEAAETDLDTLRHEAAIASDAATAARSAADRLQIEKTQLESRLQTEEVRLTAALKRAEDLSDELGNLRAAHEELKLKLDRAQRAPAAGSDAQATRIRTLEASLAEAEAGRRYAEDELRKEKDMSVRATQDALRETQKAKTLSKKLEQQETRLAEVESQLRDVTATTAGQRLEVEIALAKARAAETAKADLQRQVDELQTENKSLAARVTRASRFVKPMRSQSNVPTAFAEKIDFGVHLLKKTGSKWLEESRAQAEAASRPQTGSSPLPLPHTPPTSPPQPQPQPR